MARPVVDLPAPALAHEAESLARIHLEAHTIDSLDERRPVTLAREMFAKVDHPQHR